MAERYGYINRALPANELSPFVERLAQRIASFPAEAVALAKTAVDGGDGKSTVEALLAEEHCFNQALGTESARERMAGCIQAGGQTRQAELELDTQFDLE